MIETILKGGNKFSADDVETLSRQFFEIFHLELKPNSVINQEDARLKSELLNSYLIFFNNVLRSKLDASIIKKVELIKIMNKLKLQQEVFEMIINSSKLIVPENIREAALHMGKKSQSSLKK